MRQTLTPHRLLVGVAVLYVVTQAIVVTPRMFLGWDEALYLSQFAPGVPPLYMTAPRAFGTALLAAPVAVFTGSVAVIRIYLGLLSGLGVYLAYRPWLRRHGFTVPLAALLFCGLWLSIFYGPEAMPNVASACCAVAAVGWFLGPDTWPGRLALVAALGLMSLIRPLDALWTAIPLVAAALVRREWRRPAPIALGLAIGWVPWIVEAYVRFGGLMERYRLIDAENGNGLHLVILRQLQSFSSGTLQCMPGWRCGQVTATGLSTWALIAVLTALAIRARRRWWLPAGVALAFALPYLVLTGIANPRFLLPSYGLLLLPAANSLRVLARRRIGLVAAVAVTGVFLGGQLSTALTVADANYRARLRQAHIAGRLAAIGIRPPCLVYGSGAAPIGYATKCAAVPTMHGLPASPPALLRRRAAAGTQVVALGTTPAGPAWRGFQHLRLLARRPWHAYLTLPAVPVLGGPQTAAATSPSSASAAATTITGR